MELQWLPGHQYIALGQTLTLRGPGKELLINTRKSWAIWQKSNTCIYEIVNNFPVIFINLVELFQVIKDRMLLLTIK
jgi:hypothetical protein